MKVRRIIVKEEIKSLVLNIKNLENDETETYVYIGRPSPWGNPFIIGKDGDRKEVIKKYSDWIRKQPELMEKAKKELKQKTLGCYCSPLPCHGHVLAMIANSD